MTYDIEQNVATLACHNDKARAAGVIRDSLANQGRA
jgi:hypothetical protein